MQLTKEDRDYVRREVAVENFLVDGSSSDENIDYNMVLGGIFVFLYPFNSQVWVCVLSTMVAALLSPVLQFNAASSYKLFYTHKFYHLRIIFCYILCLKECI